MPFPIVETRPVESLPVELLVDILLLVLWAKRSRGGETGFEIPNVRSFYRLRLVCRSWNAVIESTPAFWSILDNRAPAHWTDLCLERSRGAPLRVHYSTAFEACAPKRPPSETYLAALGTTVSRWETLRIHVDDADDVPDIPAAIQRARAPRLTSLSVLFLVEAGGITILAGGAPLLTDLRVEAETFDAGWLESARLTGLESLYVGLYGAHVDHYGGDEESGYGYVPVSAHSALLDTLQRTRGTLRRFVLDGIYADSITPIPKATVVTLPELRFLMGDKLRPTLMRALLSPLRVPALRTMFLYIPLDENDDDGTPIEMSVAFLRSQSWSSRGLDVRFDHRGRLRIAVLNPELDVVLCFTHSSWSTFFERARLPIDEEEELVVHLVVGSTDHHGIYTDLERWLRSQVTTLELSMSETSQGATFRSAALRILGEIGHFKSLRAVALPRAQERDAVRDIFTEALLKPFGIELKYSGHSPADAVS